MLKKGQSYTLNIQLKASSTLLGDVIITDQKEQETESFSRIKPKHVSVLPGNSWRHVEAILKDLTRSKLCQ